MKQRRWLSILLSLILLLTLLPAQAFAEEGPDGTESICTQTADCPAQEHEPDCPLWQENETDPEETDPEETDPEETDPDETGPEETGPDETGPEETVPGETGPDETSPEEPAEPDEAEEPQPTAVEQVLALIQALPDPSDVTAENAAEVEAQLEELLALYQALDADGQEEVGDAILPAIELKAALDSLNGEDSGEPMLLADNITYLDASGTPQTCASATVVDDSTTTWGAGWYVVDSDVTISSRVTVSGDVHLILADGKTLTAKQGGINVPSGSSLTIYGQENGTGKLVATGTTNDAGIGGNDGSIGDGSSGTITINGGTVEATGGGSGAGIGGGAYHGDGNNITINGGTVTATGGRGGGAGIGGGLYGNGRYITISGGTVTATGNGGGAGIGGGNGSENSMGFYTTKSGNAFIVASSISDTSGKSSSWSGVIITGSTGQVYGSPTLTTDATISKGVTLTVPEGTTLTIAEGTTLTNNGTIIKNGTINGTVTGNQPQVQVTYQAYNEDGTFSEKTTVATAVTSSSTAWGTENTETWYVVDSDVTISDRITVSGDVHLILADGKTLNAKQGITVTDGNSLTIYGQEKGTGKLVADGGYNYSAGIGGEGMNGSGSNITINGGTVEATGGIAGAGIGGGYGGSGSNITINGGTVTANGRNGAASIGGGGFGGSGSNITIRGGFVTAQGDNGAGIGGGGNGSGSYITISGGTVTATGGDGAGIGGAGIGNGSYITISGGTVTATGGMGGAGIGGGSGGSEGGSGSNITISGGTVTATGSGGGAGIGGGTNGSGSEIAISGGFVTAQGGNGIVYESHISGGGAAIGSGGSRSSYEDGAEESDSFTDCVVLRQSGSETTMTGQVYDNCTLTTDATVPAGAILTVPEDAALTVGTDTTLTNSGTIYVDGTVTEKENGDITGDVYYQLTVTETTDGVTVDVTGTTTYADKTYAVAGTSVTMTPPSKVGQTARVTYTINDTEQTGTSFTMPERVTTVKLLSVDYDNTPGYTVTIPGDVTIGGTATVTAKSVNVAADYSLNVKLTGTGADGTGTDFTLTLKDDDKETLAYTVTKGTGANAQPVNVKDTVLTVAGGTANSSGTATLSFALADTAVVKYSGTYTGTVTFTVSVDGNS